MAVYGIPNEFRSFFNRGSEMIDSGGWFTVKDIIRPYADAQKFQVQFPECFGVVVYPFEQNRLVTNIDTTGKQVEYGLCGFFRNLVGMIALGIDPDRNLVIHAQHLFQPIGYSLGQYNRRPCTETDHLKMRNFP